MNAYAPPQDSFAYAHIDANLIVIDKPAGLLSVPGRGEEKSDCALARTARDHPGALVVHRLDMATSGLLIFARDKDTQRALSGQFARGEVAKTYIADCWGAPQPASGRIDLPLITDWPNRPRQMIDHAIGKQSLTLYETLCIAGQFARLRLTPKTGRSHQLRVHLAAIGHAILGDDLYAPPDALAAARRLHLHASALRFVHPKTGESLDLASPVPF